ncbi:MAG: T9SS type A sorting domain-containing protein [bacterium]
MTPRKIVVSSLIVVLVLGVTFLLRKERSNNDLAEQLIILSDDGIEIGSENAEKRARYEWLISMDIKTGKIPDGIRAEEMEWSKKMPIRKDGVFSDGLILPYLPQTYNPLTVPNIFQNESYTTSNTAVNNTYTSAGPSQNGGRTRTIVFDKRYNGTSNKVILAGGITGGIFRSTDGGVTWNFVHPANEIRSVSSIAQDTRPGKEDTWYAGTGEPIGASASYPNAFVFGNGMFKSVDNGVTWTKLPSTKIEPANNKTLTSEWSFVHKVAVHPTTGHVYAAVHRRVLRSKDEGATWEEVFVSAGGTPASGDEGMADILINNSGSQIYIAMTGRYEDRSMVGVFSSNTGDASSYNRIAGGLANAPDSVAGWRAYDNTISQSGMYTGGWGRIVLALAPSNQNILYVMVENSESAGDNKPEADLFKCDMSATPFTWSNLGINLEATRKPAGQAESQAYMELQGGYNMLLAVHPTNPNIVLAGGVYLFRSTDGFATKNNVTYVGGLPSTTYNDPDDVSHVDYHGFAFDKANNDRVYLVSDGGIASIKDITVDIPEWEKRNSQYQTLQYYHVGIDPTPGSQTFYGGAQDNSTTFRDPTNIIPIPKADGNDHLVVLGGDGCQVGMSKKNNSGNQFLYCAAQEGQIYRMKLFDFNNSLFTRIKPDNTGDGEFITYFHLDPDNTEYLYFAMNDTLYKTGAASTVTQSNWTLMSGIAQAVTGSIFSLETTRGSYSSNSHLFIGTSRGKIFRLKDPQSPLINATQPTDITPSQMPQTLPINGFQYGVVVKDISVNPRNQDTLMAVVSNYGTNSIYWTGNATSANPVWQVIDGNIGPFSVRSCEIIAKTTGVEYYIGTTSGLYSTTSINGSATVWLHEVGVAGQPSQMLNTAIVNSLAHRWEDNTMVIGTHGNGMFSATLGNPITITTAVTTPIRNNTDFIKTLFPTISDDQVQFQIGNMYSVKKLNIEVVNTSGALVYKKETGYLNGTIPIRNLAAGTYVVTITSNDRKYQFTRKIIKR